ncbi:OmpA family protein [Wenyingzhuangia aestuarii]|uniref:OmpA family protein n=1 Tax=Wenyingzhuangia aestuarii TaxID=1647582 RepID=UPI00143C5858|nr:OmpA family protein [Wenyingzhuangia aestuarii]NJB83722.1 outer membrane protein OmpA-like peptidoglycan-associated protein [Wenyingzhuangia aestuarii]
MKKIFKKLVLVCLSASMFTGCSSMNNTTKGGLLGTGAGAAIGAGIGALIGGKKGAAIGAIGGAAVGGTTGVIIGKKMDKQAEELRNSIPGAQVYRVGEGIDVVFDEGSGIYFGSNQTVVNQDTKNVLDKLAVVLQKYPDTNLFVTGHTDSDGSEAYNLTLSEKRANAVAGYLKNLGVPADRFTVKGEGEVLPIADNSTKEGKAKNRRVELAIVANETMIKEAKAEAKQ